jgi:hypothetical protein
MVKRFGGSQPDGGRTRYPLSATVTDYLLFGGLRCTPVVPENGNIDSSLSSRNL